MDIDTIIREGNVCRRAAEAAAEAVEDGRINPQRALEYAKREDAALRRGVSKNAANAAFNVKLPPFAGNFRWVP